MTLFVKALKEMKWYVFIAIFVIGIKVMADFMGVSIWPWQKNETNAANQSGRIRLGNTYYHK